MNLRHRLTGLTALAAGLALAAPASAQTYNSGSTGALGAVTITENTEIVLPPDGVLDYTTFTVEPGATVTFARNQANTPVVIRAQSDVVINGTIDISGKFPVAGSSGMGYTSLGGLGGPGGGDGGACETVSGTNRAGGGIGPGGGRGVATGAGGGGASPHMDGQAGYQQSSATRGVAVGDWKQQQLFGGSGGACGMTNPGSGGGGGITIASSSSIQINGAVRSRGGIANNRGGAGGGGFVRLVAPSVTGTGNLDTQGSGGTTCSVSTTSRQGGCGGHGFMKVEAFEVSGTYLTKALPLEELYFGKPLPAIPGTTAAAKPRLRVVSVVGASGGVQDPGTPDWSEHPLAQTPAIFLDDGQSVTVTVAAENVEVGKFCRVRFNTLGNNFTEKFTTALDGTYAASTATATLTMPNTTRLMTIEAWVEDTAIPAD